MPALSAFLYTLAAGSGAAAALRQSDAAPIFCFHNVVRERMAGGPGDASLHLSVSEFASALEVIAALFTIIPLEELRSRLRSGRALRGTACLTFDDAYRGAIVHAIPLLRRRAYPATVFVVSDAAAEPRAFWWDVERLNDEDRSRLLVELNGDGRRISAATHVAVPDDMLPGNWELLESSIDETIVAGCHTATHRNLSTLSDAEIDEELRSSRDVIAGRVRYASVLAYPYGFASRRVVTAAARAGFDCAVTLGFGRVHRGSHEHALPRVNVPAGLRTETLECWSSGLRFGRAPIRVSREGSSTIPSGERRLT